MRELPIIYSAPMILAKLAGRKTMTRRTRGLEAVNVAPDDWEFDVCGPGQVVANSHRSTFAKFQHKKTGEEVWLRCPYGQPGDVLYARESIWQVAQVGYSYPEDDEGYTSYLPIYHYAADGSPKVIGKNEWNREIGWTKEKGFIPYKGHQFWKSRPSIHMPKVAARIWDEVVSIKVERVQDITEEDAIAEGLAKLSKDDGRTWKYGIADRDGLPGNDDFGWSWVDWNVDSREAFFSLWRRINGEESWNLNPYVWCVTTKNLSTTGKP